MTEPEAGTSATEDARPHSAERWLMRVEDLGIAIAGAMLAFAMLVIVIDVFMRYFFNSPLRWSYDLLALFLIPSMFYLSLAQALRQGDHICVDFFVHLMSVQVRRAVMIVGMTCALIALLAMSYVLLRDGFNAFLNGENVVGYYVWPIWIPKAVAFLGTFVLSIRVVVMIVRLVRAIAAREA